ncbi:MAG: hypothetical protein HFI75_00820 [Lachnospiraceae bacterium]|nr:hypothetical protein [Lachnospiraceae bacterium]
MAYDMEEIRISQEIFYYLLEKHELREEQAKELYRAYTDNEQIQNLVQSQGEAAQAAIERYGSVIYLIPNEDNYFLGFSKAELKAVLCKSGAVDRDYYLSQFVILTLLVEFYDGQGSSSKSRDYMKVGELQNSIALRLQEGAQQSSNVEAEELEIAFSNMLAAYSALRSEEKGSKAKTTKEGFLYHVLKFLEKQGLIDYIEEDEMIKTSQKLDNFMDWNLLNQNHYERVLHVLGVM